MQVANSEKRRFVRYSIERDMQVILQGQSISGKLVNVSARGAGIVINPNEIEFDENGLMILRCQVAGEIIDISLQIRHMRSYEDFVYVGGEVVNDFNRSLIDYIHEHAEASSDLDSIDQELTDHFINNVADQTNHVFNDLPSRDIDQDEALSKVIEDPWMSYIGLSSQILTTRIYLNYNLCAVRKLSKLTNSPESSLHDFMREKTNVIAGAIKRWVLSHQDVDDAICGNFMVRMPCTEKVNEHTVRTLKTRSRGKLWCLDAGDGLEIMCCVVLQVDHEEKATRFLEMMNHAISESEDDDDIEFL